MLIATGSVILYTGQCCPLKSLQNFCFPAVLKISEMAAVRPLRKQRPRLQFAPGWTLKLHSAGLISYAEGKFPSDALWKAAQTRSAASCRTAKYLFHSGAKWTFLWFCVSFVQLLSLVFNLLGGEALRSARGMCPSTDRGSCTRGQRSGKLSALLSERTQTDRRTWIIPFLTTWQLLWRSLFRLQRPCWCLPFFFLPSVFV